MEQKSRKLLSRLGAAFLLGLSMFNFGAAWNRLRGGEMPRNVRNIRKRSQENINSDVREIAMIAEQEAQIALASEQFEKEQSTQQLQDEKMGISQRLVQYTAISVWVVSAGLVFSSAIFNYPFGLGKAMLSVLPGIPHVASLKLETPTRFFEVGQEVPVKIVLDSTGERVSGATFSLTYDPQIMSFERYEINELVFDKSKEYYADFDKGVVSLSVENSLEENVFQREALGTFFFRANSQSAARVGLDQANSFVYKKTKEGASANILGKVEQAEFRILQAKGSSAFCFEEKENFANSSRGEVAQDQWEVLAKGAILPSNDGGWNPIDPQWAFVCSYNTSGEVKILFSGPRSDLESVQFTIPAQQDSGVFLNISKKWQEGATYFFGAKITKADLGQEDEIDGVEIAINLPDESIEWPSSGKAKFILR